MHIHILGIAGKMTLPIAQELIRLGHQVSGSDQENIYPPVSTQIDSLQISFNQTPIFSKIDLVIVGSSYSKFSRCIEEFELVKQLNIPYLSATKFISDWVIKKESILVAGTHGKSTISALLAWVFHEAGMNPSYFSGSELINDIPSLKITNSDFSIVEADESINGLDEHAKFLYYPVKYLILTSASWEHKDSYKNEQENFEAFKTLVTKIPKDGVLFYNQLDSYCQKLVGFCQGKAIPFNASDTFTSNLIGNFNQENIAAAVSVASYFKIDHQIIVEAVKSFNGIKRRLELVLDGNIKVYDDFAQSVERVTSAIDAVRSSYENSKIIVYFEPNATFLQTKTSLEGFRKSFESTEKVILGKIKFSSDIPKTQRTSAADWSREVGDKLQYLPLDTQVVEFFTHYLTPGDILVHFSSGGLTGLENLQAIINHIKVYNLQ